MIAVPDIRPRRRGREEVGFLLPRLCPSDFLLKILRGRLLHGEPIILERLLFIADVGNPGGLVARRDAIRLCQYA